jgi:hypothetical protein
MAARDPSIYPPDNQLGGAVPTEESSPLLSGAGDISSTQGLSYDPGATGVPAPSSSGIPPSPEFAVVEPTRYRRTARIPFALTTAPLLALPAPAGYRTFLVIRNDATSAGNVLIDFDIPNPTPTTASFVLTPGGVAFFDAAVPLGDLYLASSSTAIAVVTFANAPIPPGVS